MVLCRASKSGFSREHGRSDLLVVYFLRVSIPLTRAAPGGGELTLTPPPRMATEDCVVEVEVLYLYPRRFKAFKKGIFVAAENMGRMRISHALQKLTVSYNRVKL